MAEMELENLLDAKQVAKMLGLAPRTLDMWRYRKKGPPYVRLENGEVRYSPRDVREWLAEQRRLS